MDFVINAIGMPFNGETLLSKSLGGSESAAYYLGRELARKGHRVTMFTTSQDEGTWDGVQYCYCGELSQHEPLGKRFNFYATTTPHDVLIIQRHPLGFHRDYASKINVWQLHDLALFRTQGIVQGGLPRVDFTTAVSQFHADQITKVYDIKGGAIKVVPNGVDPDLYVQAAQSASYTEALTALGIANDSKQFRLLYQSRPERGLEHLVRPGGIMDRLRDTRAHLYYCSYDHVTEQMAPYYAQLNAWAAALPNVTNLGALTKATLASVQKRSDLLIYPTEFEEVSCITVMEAMHAALPVVTSAHGALPETCKDAGVELLPLLDGRADEDAFVAFVNMVMLDLDDLYRERVSVLGRMQEAQRTAAKTRTWAHAASVLLGHVTEQFEARHRNVDRVARHCIEHADIGFLDYVLKTAEQSDLHNPIMACTMNERVKMYSFADNRDAHIKHYEFWEGDNLDRLDRHGFDARTEIDGVKNMTRFIGIRSLIADALDAHKADRPLRVFEFGCAHGHIALALAETFGNAIHITGMDFMGRSVVKAAENAAALGLTNAAFLQGDQNSLEDLTPDHNGYDVVLAAEVIEHIYDYQQTLNALCGIVADGGTMVFTTPTGRWEWTGHENFPKGREHLHHFERDDWLDMCADFESPQVMFAPAGTDGVGGGLGSWVVAVKTVDGSERFRSVNYERKLRALAPRETVSLCMIAKDAEHTIGRALASVMQYVDEVVIGIDAATTDETRAVIARTAERWPYVPFTVFDGAAAIESGFDAARNATVDRATGDWIMWMDADEEVPQPHNLWRLLRPSNFNAYACPQIHYSAMPAQVLTSDFPCRLFRATRGVQFYGLVHEHPEDAPGKSITPAAMASDLQFMHAGYVDEPTRRRRYHRNLPLLIKDCDAHPTRLLNKFLMLRDIAQGIQFDAMANRPSPDHGAQANRGLALFDELLSNRDVPLRMVIDGVQYASVCNELLQQGFIAKFNWQTQRPPFDTMSTEGTADGRFKDRSTFTKLINRIIEESTQHYESPYA